MVIRSLVMLSALLSAAASAIPAAAPENKEDTATVVLQESFPIRVLWSIDEDKKGEIEDKQFAEIPIGKEVSVAPATRFHGEYSTILVRYRLNGGKPTEISDRAWEGELKKGDKLEVMVVGVGAPQHGALVPYKDGVILVSVVHPLAQTNEEAGFDPEGKEEFRSSAMFFGKYGFTKVSRKLAAHVLDNLGQFQAQRGKYRDKQQVAVLFPAKDGKMLQGQASGTEDELAEALEIGFRVIGKQPIADATFNDQIEKAQGLLKKKD